jgi:hypothetical protein
VDDDAGYAAGAATTLVDVRHRTRPEPITTRKAVVATAPEIMNVKEGFPAQAGKVIPHAT